MLCDFLPNSYKLWPNFAKQNPKMNSHFFEFLHMNFKKPMITVQQLLLNYELSYFHQCHGSQPLHTSSIALTLGTLSRNHCWELLHRILCEIVESYTFVHMMECKVVLNFHWWYFYKTIERNSQYSICTIQIKLLMRTVDNAAEMTTKQKKSIPLNVDQYFFNSNVILI